MKRPETIIIHYVHDYIRKDYDGKYAGKYVLSFAGVSDKPSKLMHLQTWDMPFDTRDEAQLELIKYQKNMEEMRKFIIIVVPKVTK